MDLLKEIGAILGFVAFAGLAVLVFLTFQQARHLRRLRDWAGRSPERAEAEAERALGGAGDTVVAGRGTRASDPSEASGVTGDAGDAAAGPGRMHRLRGEVSYRYEELDRRTPVSPLVLFGGLLALLVAAVILTSGFGLVGSSDDSTSGGPAEGEPVKPEKVEVAVLNGTAPEGGVGVPGTAKAASAFVEEAGFEVGEVGDAGSFTTSSILFEDGFKSDASELASNLEDVLGPIETVAITSEVQELADGADLVLVIGQDDQGLAG